MVVRAVVGVSTRVRDGFPDRRSVWDGDAGDGLGGGSLSHGVRIVSYGKIEGKGVSLPMCVAFSRCVFDAMEIEQFKTSMREISPTLYLFLRLEESCILKGLVDTKSDI